MRLLLNQGTLPLKHAYVLRDRDRLVREFILQLKLGKVEAEPFRAKFEVGIEDVFGGTLSELGREGMIEVTEGGVVLTREGLRCVDRLLPDFYDPRCRDRRYT